MEVLLIKLPIDIVYENNISKYFFSYLSSERLGPDIRIFGSVPGSEGFVTQF